MNKQKNAFIVSASAALVLILGLPVYFGAIQERKDSCEAEKMGFSQDR